MCCSLSAKYRSEFWIPAIPLVLCRMCNKNANSAYIRLPDSINRWIIPLLGFPKSGKTAVIGKGMTWLQLIPDGKKHVITAVYLPDNTLSICYVDVIENIEYDPDGVLVFIDKYIDIIFTPQGDLIIDDRDELDEALQCGDISQDQYDAALRECDLIISELCSDIAKTNRLLDKILNYVNDKVE